MKVFCVIPCFNEEKNIASVIKKVKPYVSEIVVVDDGSEDDTYNQALSQNVTVLRHFLNRGQGAALETGNRYALKNKADIIVHFDADGQFLAEEIADVIKPIQERQAEVVFGSRFLGKESNMPKSKRYIIIPLAKFVNRLIIKEKLTDPQSGFRALSGKAALQIEIKQDKMAHCSEIIYKVFKKNIPAREVPITVIYNDFGQKFGGGLKIIKDLIMGNLIK